MVDNWQLAMALRFVTEFTVTEDHLKLLRHAVTGTAHHHTLCL